MTADPTWPRDIRPVAEDEPRDVVILGGGVSAHRCAFDLRRAGYDGGLTLVSAEGLPPYDRTLLSKDMLHGSGACDVVPLDESEAYHGAGIDLRLGVRGENLDLERRRVGLDDGTARSYDRLVLCVGGSPVLPRALDAPGVHVIREAAGVERLRDELIADSHLVIIGGGFIGGEVATAASRRGVEVTVVESAAQPLATALGNEVGERVAALHRDHGVKVLTRTQVESVSATGNGYDINLADASISADSVVVGVGMTPNTDWLLGSGLHIDRGIVTDAGCRTSDDGVFAAGDCARWWHPGYADLCRVEHWDTANRHGAAVAQALLGTGQPFAPLPFFWSDQFGVKFQFAGRAGVWDDVRVEGESPGRFVARYFTAGVLTGVLAAGQPRVFAALRRELMAAQS